MPRQEDNVIMRNTRGTFADQVVFKIRKGVSIVAKPTRKKPNQVATVKQEAVKEKFRAAVRYAKAAIKNLQLKADYEAAATGGQTAYNVAFKDAQYAPTVHQIITQKYTGEAGSLVSVEASDAFRVVKVNIVIRNAAGVLVEQGAAVIAEDNRFWNYTATTANANLAGTKITAEAYDLPDNVGALEVTL